MTTLTISPMTSTLGAIDGQGAVEEEHVLHVEHELLGHARPVAEEALGEVADLGGELLGGERGGVDGGPVEAEVADHGVDVDVGGQGAEVAHGRDLAGDVVGGRRHDQAQEGQAPGLVEAAGDAEVEQGHAAVGLHEAGCRRAGRRGRRRRAARLRGRRSSAARRTASVSMPAARMASASPHAKPSRRSMTSTRRVTSAGGDGGRRWRVWPVSASTRATSSMFWASRRKSSSSTMVSANSSTSAGGLARAATGIRPTRRGAIQLMAARSRRTRRGHVGPLHLDHDGLAGARGAPRGPGRSTRPRWARGRTR